MNKGKSGLGAQWVRALGALRSLQSKKKLSAEKRQKTHFEWKEEKEKWSVDYVARETAVAREWIQDAETAIMEEQENMRNVKYIRSTTTKTETTFEEMLNAVGDSLSDLASADVEEDGEDEDDEEDLERGKLSEDDQPGWVMGTIFITVQHDMGRFWQAQMRLDELTQPELGDAANYFRLKDMKHGTTELKVPAVVKPQIDTTAPTPSPITFGEFMQALDIVPGQSQMTQVTSWPRSSQMRLGSEKPQPRSHIAYLVPDVVKDSSQIVIAKPVEPASFYPCIYHPQLITT